MGKICVKINESNLIDPNYQCNRTLNCVVEGTTPAQLAELEAQLYSVRGQKKLSHGDETFQMVESRPSNQAPSDQGPKTVVTPKTPEEKAAAEKRLQNAAIKKAIKQQFCVLDHSDLANMSVKRITKELVSFYEADPNDPVRWNKILVLLGDLGVMNASPYLKFDKHIPKAVLRPIVRGIFLSRNWTDLMLTCLKHYKEFFDGKEWQKLKSSFYKAVYRLYLRISSKEDVTKLAGMTKLPRKMFDLFRPVWDFLQDVPLSIYC